MEALLRNLKANSTNPEEYERKKFEASLKAKPSDAVQLDPRLTPDGQFVAPEDLPPSKK